MADIYCPRCGEPWPTDALHEAYDETAGEKIPYDVAAANFKRFGCGAMTGTKPTCPLDPTAPRAMLAQFAMEMSESPDDWAADLADQTYLGKEL